MSSLLDRANAKKLLYGALLKLRADALLYARIRMRRAVVILNLHRVSPETNAYWPPLHPADLDELLGFVARRFDVCTISELGEQRPGSPRPQLVLSFDDGYHDFVEHAMPVLHKRRMRANQNIIGSAIETGTPPWNVQLYDFLNAAPRSLLREIRLPGFDLSVPDFGLDGPQRFGTLLTRFLKRRPRAERAPMLEAIAPILERAEVRPTRMMTEDEAIEVGRAHELGCHSHSHESMGFEANAFLLEDLARCRKLFEKLNQPLTIYAFPNGSYRPDQIRLLLENRVRYVLLVDERHNAAGQHVLARITVGGGTVAETKLMAMGLRSGGLNRDVDFQADAVS